MSAESLGNDERDTVDEAARKVLRYLSDGVETIGGIEVASGICGGVDRSDLRRALDRNGRYLRVEHAIAIGARLRRFNYGLATQLGSALVHPMDLEVFPRVALTDKERADRFEALVRRMPHGDQLVAEVLRGRR